MATQRILRGLPFIPAEPCPFRLPLGLMVAVLVVSVFLTQLVSAVLHHDETLSHFGDYRSQIVSVADQPDFAVKEPLTATALGAIFFPWLSTPTQLASTFLWDTRSQIGLTLVEAGVRLQI